jgi:four helix bundle protein
MRQSFSHERLDAYRVALGVARWAATVHVPAQRRHLRDQLVLAADSVVLNLAEGGGRAGDARRNHYRIARGSAAEVCAVLDLLCPTGAAERQDELRRVGAMLTKMIRK